MRSKTLAARKTHERITVLPILIPMFTGVLCLLAYRSTRLQRILGMAGTVVLFSASLALILSTLNHEILVLADRFLASAFWHHTGGRPVQRTMQLLTALLAWRVGWYSLGMIGESRFAFGYFALFSLLMMGVNGAFLTGDIFNLYVWFEVC